MKYKVTIELTDGTMREIYEEAANRKHLDELIDWGVTLDYMYVDFKRVVSIQRLKAEKRVYKKKVKVCPRCIELEKKIKDLEEYIKEIEIPF